ncbi:MAG: hypothetical protein J5965_28550 [Aeriscardovia sp.]|nr:hypothetical protein [Aeriscardovia sp.]MBP3842925.1 hypothetical protein [Prevotella sp.]
MDKFIGKNGAFWPSYVDIMTTLFAIMLVLFTISYGRFQGRERSLIQLNDSLQEFKDKYNEIKSIYTAVENINSDYFEFNPTYVKHIFRIQVTYQRGQFDLYSLEDDANGNISRADSLRKKIIKAGEEIRSTIVKLQNNDSIKQDIKYLVVIEGQASKDGFNTDEWHNNNVLSYQRALALHHFWRDKANIDFSDMEKCELVISGSGEGGVPRDQSRETNNQRFLIHIVPVIGNIHL